MNIREEARKMKLVAPVLAASSNEMRNSALRAIAEALAANKEKIFAANAEDCRAAEDAGIAPAVMKRLAFNESKLADVCKGIDQLISLPDPIGKSLLKRELDAGLVLERVSVPIGVIGVIFEARPDATGSSSPSSAMQLSLPVFPGSVCCRRSCTTRLTSCCSVKRMSICSFPAAPTSLCSTS